MFLQSVAREMKPPRVLTLQVCHSASRNVSLHRVASIVIFALLWMNTGDLRSR
jgi:hypothetical protein